MSKISVENHQLFEARFYNSHLQLRSGATLFFRFLQQRDLSLLIIPQQFLSNFPWNSFLFFLLFARYFFSSFTPTILMHPRVSLLHSLALSSCSKRKFNIFIHSLPLFRPISLSLFLSFFHTHSLSPSLSLSFSPSFSHSGIDLQYFARFLLDFSSFFFY